VVFEVAIIDIITIDSSSIGEITTVSLVWNWFHVLNKGLALSI